MCGGIGPVAGVRRNDACGRIDTTNAVVESVRDEGIAGGVEDDSERGVQPCDARQAAVATETLLAGSGKEGGSATRIELPDTMCFGGHIDVARRVVIDTDGDLRGEGIARDLHRVHHGGDVPGCR
jgi:hypothetical protein